MNVPGVSGLADWQRERLRGSVGGAYYDWAGVRLVELGPGTSRLVFRPRSEMLTPWNTLNGSVLNGLLELPSFLALLPELREDEQPVTNDLFLQHLRPLPGDAEYVLEGRLIRRGRSMAWTEASASVDGKPTTLARITKTLVTAGTGTSG
ncbi:MAG: PaaI family thioesterase [Proteobacteria bacterium]|nr:PaaI family thioesterase [Pseudomonadota bacterium]